MNWRAILGLVLLIIGMWELYLVTANKDVAKFNMPPLYIEIGCLVWMAVGVMLIVRGTQKKDH